MKRREFITLLGCVAARGARAAANDENGRVKTCYRSHFRTNSSVEAGRSFFCGGIGAVDLLRGSNAPAYGDG
jgi:hypothetical protein